MASDFSKTTYKARQEWRSVFKKQENINQEIYMQPSYSSSIKNIEKQFWIMQGFQEYYAHMPFLRNSREFALHSTKRWLGTFQQKDWGWAFHMFNWRARTNIRLETWVRMVCKHCVFWQSRKDAIFLNGRKGSERREQNKSIV